MTESKLQSWWRTVIMPALLETSMNRENREMVESATVEMNGTELVIRGGDHVIASPAIADLITKRIDKWPPPAPLVVRTTHFPEMDFRASRR